MAEVNGYSIALFPQHVDMLAGSGITAQHASARGYVSVDTKTRLEGINITRAGRNVPGVLVPMLRKDGSTWGWQYRPDRPRDRDGRAVKYETPTGQRNGIDVPPGVGEKLDDPSVPLWVTEGVKKADAGALAGLCIVALPGVWSWRGSNVKGGKVAVADWQDIALNGRRVILAFDSDVVRKHAVRTALDALAGYVRSKGARVEYLHLPDDEVKTGLDDYLTDGHGIEELWRLVRPEPPALIAEPTTPTIEAGDPFGSPARTAPVVVEPRTLAETRAAFTRWLGEEYDLTVLDVVLAVAAAERLTGDPAWLLVVSGPGAAKTETVATLAGAGAFVTSTITSEGALLSGTSNKERSKDATGGLLRKIGGHGVLVIKDVTSILSMNRDARGGVLAALREVYDGMWERNLGTDGGKSLRWTGRLVVIGAVTTAWDRAHSVVSAMGDRFILVRLDSTAGRVGAGRQAIRNTGNETDMRTELANVVGGLLAGVDTSVNLALTEEETEALLAVANVVTLARTGVERDYRGDVIDAHAPEMPTRFAKQLTQVMRGALALGMSREHALVLARRCAADSVPPLRLAVLLDLLDHPDSTTHAVRQRLDKPRTTVDRELQALHMLDLLTLDEVEAFTARGEPASRWHYSLAEEQADPDTLALLGGTRNVTTYTQDTKVEGSEDTPDNGDHGGTDISGTSPMSSLDQLRARPDRCSGCGFHVETQWHDPTCKETR